MLIPNGQRFGREMNNTNTTTTIEILRRIFAVFGLPEQIVSDNGPQFVSDEFSRFMRNNGIKHFRSAPYHPAKHGAIERFVQTFKKALIAGRKEGRTNQHIISNFLLKYRTTPHSVTGMAPCNLMMNRSLRTVLDLLRPNITNHVNNKQASQKSAHDKHLIVRKLCVGDQVMVRSYRCGDPKWVNGTVVKQMGEVSYMVKLSDGIVWKRHIDQLVAKATNTQDDCSWSYGSTTREAELPVSDPSSEGSVLGTTTVNSNDRDESSTGSTRRYPQMFRRPPERYS